MRCRGSLSVMAEAKRGQVWALPGRSSSPPTNPTYEEGAMEQGGAGHNGCDVAVMPRCRGVMQLQGNVSQALPFHPTGKARGRLITA